MKSFHGIPDAPHKCEECDYECHKDDPMDIGNKSGKVAIVWENDLGDVHFKCPRCRGTMKLIEKS